MHQWLLVSLYVLTFPCFQVLQHMASLLLLPGVTQLNVLSTLGCRCRVGSRGAVDMRAIGCCASSSMARRAQHGCCDSMWLQPGFCKDRRWLEALLPTGTERRSPFPSLLLLGQVPLKPPGLPLPCSHHAGWEPQAGAAEMYREAMLWPWHRVGNPGWRRAALPARPVPG